MHAMPLTRRSMRTFSTRQVAQLETQVLDKLRSVSDGLGLGDIVSLGRVKVQHQWIDPNGYIFQTAHLHCYVATLQRCDLIGGYVACRICM